MKEGREKKEKTDKRVWGGGAGGVSEGNEEQSGGRMRLYDMLSQHRVH